MRRINLLSLKKDDISLIIEKGYPSVISSFIVITYVLVNPKLIADDLDNILNAIISFTSILLGFIGVLITLIFSLTSLSIIGNIFKRESLRELMHLYFRRCIQSGFILIICTIVLFFRNTIGHIELLNFHIINFKFIDIVKVMWVFLTPYFSLASYRIISIVLKAAFTPNIVNENLNTTGPIADNDYSELRDKYQ